MKDKWLVFCEEAGDKELMLKQGSSSFYIVTSILIKQEDEQSFIDAIEDLKNKILGMKGPLEWKHLYGTKKRNDKLLGRFLKKIGEESPHFLVSNVICNKRETTGPGLIDKNTFMNYLYGLMFKRISWFLGHTNSTARLIIDRNTDKLAQTSLHHYISLISRGQTGQPPRHSKPSWINPEDHPILGLADFVSGISLRSLDNYLKNSHAICNPCLTKRNNCIYRCTRSNYEYQASYRYIADWNYDQLPSWNWRGLLYHPFEYKDDYKNLFQPR